MNHPLDGARLKVIRAQEHVDSLKAEIGMYLKEDPYEIVTNQNADETYTTTIRTTIPPPLRLSTIVGDCLTNARAALDYTMFQLARISFAPAFDITNGNDRKIVSFPLFENVNTDPDSAYVNRFNCLTNRMRAIPNAADAIDRIKWAQPYNTGQRPLWWLHELVNSDKHRMPLLTIGPIDTFSARFTSSNISFEHDGEVFGGAQLTTAGSLFVTARHLATERLSIHSDAVHMNAQATVYVTLQDVLMPREPVDRTLEQIIKTAADVIPRFDSFF